jgi:uncharacterized protein YjgD (DUF1641 family)
MNTLKTLITAGVSASLLMLTACGGDAPDQADGTDMKVVDPELLDPNRSFNTAFDGKLFSVPSPVQTALLIRNTNLPYDESLLNPEKNASKYVDNVSRALNLGIYGADLGYATLYDQNAKAISYLSVVESLSNELGIAGAFDANFLTRFEKNSSNQDSMLVILTDAFRKGDVFLKENDRKNISALILTGGWLESMHFATNLYAKSKNDQILSRIGEQKQSLQTIIEILVEYNKDGENDMILAELNALNELFEDVEMEYTFVESVHDEAKKMTTLKSKTTMRISPEVMTAINNKVRDIRKAVTEGGAA